MNARLLAYLQLIRAPAVFTAISNILAAHLVAVRGDIQWQELFVLMAVSASLYSAGMILNDWFDYDQDLKTRPDRPLTSGRIPRSRALVLGSALLFAGCLLAAFAGVASVLIAITLALLILLYDGWLKATVLGAPVMAACRYFNWMLGLSVAIPIDQGWWMPLPVFLYIFALTLLSRDEESASNQSMLPMVMAIMLLAMLGLAIMAVVVSPRVAWPAILVLPAAIYLLSGFWRLYHDYSVASIQRFMSVLILFIIPLDALMALCLGAGLWSLLLLLLLLPGKMLARLIYVT